MYNKLDSKIFVQKTFPSLIGTLVMCNCSNHLGTIFQHLTYLTYRKVVYPEGGATVLLVALAASIFTIICVPLGPFANIFKRKIILFIHMFSLKIVFLMKI